MRKRSNRSRRVGKSRTTARRYRSLRVEALEARALLAGVPQLVSDINQGPLGVATSFPGMAEVNGAVFFNGDGEQLWKTDGTAAGTVLVKDVHEGPNGSVIDNLTNVNGTLFFAAHDVLFRSDGTSAGTVPLKQIPVRDSANVNGTFFFVGEDGGTGRELWKSDGTVNGTVLLKDIVPGATGSSPAQLTQIDGVLFFQVNDQLWKSDGTAGGTVLVKNNLGGALNKLTNVDGKLFFSTPSGLWTSDGTQQGTNLIKQIEVASTWPPGPVASVHGVFYFAGRDNANGRELWKSDGTAAGTVLVKDIAPGIYSSEPSSLANVGGTLYFSVGSELWKSDGSGGGTVAVKNTGGPSHLTNVSGTLFFLGSDAATGVELWKSDGTAGGTNLVKEILPGPEGSMDRGSQPSLTNINGKLFFKANDGIDGRQLWKSDGSPSGTVVVGRSASATGSAFRHPQNASNDPVPGPVVMMNHVAYFAAQNGTHGTELWRSDGTASGTQLVKDIFPGSGSSSPGLGLEMVVVNSTLYFVANDGTNGFELWRSDGTAAGTFLVRDIWPGAGSSNIEGLTNVNGSLFFSANDTISGRELWKSNGTEAGTQLVKDLRTGEQGSNPISLTNVGGTLFFVADRNNLKHLWKSDGTVDGTVFIGVSNGVNLTNVNGTLFYLNSNEHSGSLWKSDGTSGGTVRVKSLGAMTHGSSLTNVNGILFFVAYDPAHGLELWKSDGTDAGTVVVRDIRNDTNNGAGPSDLVNVDGVLFFVANDDVVGRSLWKSNGTEAGTVLVKGINAGVPQSSNISSLTNINGRLYFTGYDGVEGPFGSELWRSDGTEAGTTRVSDIAPGPLSSSPDRLRAVPGGVIFTAAEGVHGRELWIFRDHSAPFAPDKNVSAIQDTPLSIALSAIDSENDPLTFRVVSQPLHGTLSGTAPNLTYTPAAGYVGPDVFTFAANDGATDSNSATVAITVLTNMPAVNGLTATTVFNKPVNTTLAATDPRNLPLTYEITAGPANGSLSGTAPNLVYTPALEYVGPDSFTYRVSNGQSTSSIATVTLAVTIGTPPAAVNKNIAAVTNNSKPVSLDAADGDGHPLTYRIVAQPQHGTLSGTAPNLTYTPTAGYIGADSFTYVANDGKLDSNVATVAITIVNTNPVGVDLLAKTKRNKPVPLTLAATDPRGLPLSYAVASAPLHGTLSGAAPNFVYTPAVDYIGPDSFTYQASNGESTSAPALVSITVTPNHPPTLGEYGLVWSLTKTPLPLTFAAHDEDGDALTFTVLSTPTIGQITGTLPNLFYTPAAGMAEIVTLTYQASDGEALSNIGEIQILTLTVGLVVFAEDGQHTEANFAEQIFTGVGSQDLSVTTTAAAPELFAEQPTIDANGTLRFKPAPNSQGRTVVRAVLQSGAEGEEGDEVGVTAEFEIEIEQRFPWSNDVFWADTSNNGYVTPDDALIVINYLNGYGPGPAGTDSSGPVFIDAAWDNIVSAADALAVINYLNAYGITPVPEEDDEPPLPDEPTEPDEPPGEVDPEVDAGEGEGAVVGVAEQELIALLAGDWVEQCLRRKRG